MNEMAKTEVVARVVDVILGSPEAAFAQMSFSELPNAEECMVLGKHVRLEWMRDFSFSFGR